MKDYYDELSVEQAKATPKGGYFIDDDIFIIENLNKDSFPTNRRKIKGYLFILCENGNMDCVIGNKSYYGHRNSLFLLQTNDYIDNITIPSVDFQGKAILIAPKGFKYIVDSDKRLEFTQKMTTTHHLLLDSNNATLFKCNFFILKNEFICNTKNSKSNAYNLIKIVIQHIFEEIPTINRQVTDNQLSDSKKNSGKEIFKKFMLYTEDSNYRYATIATYCNICNKSYTTLERIFKRETGVTPHQYLKEIQTKDLHAILKQASPSLTVEELAKHFHFTSISSFSRHFKKEMGTSPKSYLKQNNKYLQSHTTLDTTLDQT